MLGSKAAPNQVALHDKIVTCVWMCGPEQDVLDDRTRNPYACLAARKGQTECLRLLLARGVPLDGHVSAMAAGWVGSLSCLRLAHEAGDKLDVAPYMAAASGTPLVFDAGRVLWL
jgi:hypothetical protein